MRPVPVPEWLRSQEWVKETRVYAAPNGDLTSDVIRPAEGLLYDSHYQGQSIPMVAAVLLFEEEDIAAINRGARHLLMSWVGDRMPVFITPHIIEP